MKTSFHSLIIRITVVVGADLRRRLTAGHKTDYGRIMLGKMMAVWG
jgi:hypothetical protein